jgi:hypothetical protein
MLDFLPNGGLVSTTLKCSDGSLRSESSVLSGGVVGADAVQDEIHGAQAGDAVDDVDASERLEPQVLLLVLVELGTLGDEVMRGEQEAAGAASGIADRLAGLRLDAVHHRGDQRARSEVLPRAALDVLRVALQQPFVGVALDVGRHRRPVLLSDQLDDQPPELGGVLNPVLRLAKDQAEHSALVAQLLKHVAVLRFEPLPLHLRIGEIGPAAALRNRLLLPGELGALLSHLQEEKAGELLDVVEVGKPVIPQNVAVTPKLLHHPPDVTHAVLPLTPDPQGLKERTTVREGSSCERDARRSLSPR